MTWVSGQGAVKPEAGLLYKGESLYNYFQVVQHGPETWLKLNEGIGLHSVYHPQSAFSKGIWDYFLVAPLFGKSERETEETRGTTLKACTWSDWRAGRWRSCTRMSTGRS